MSFIGVEPVVGGGGDRVDVDRASVSELIGRWQTAGDRTARDEVFARFLPLARKLAARYSNPQEPLQDLVQVASVGLLGAIDRFDPGRGIPFHGFAVPTILGELKRHFRDTGWSVHVPRGAKELALRVDLAAKAITAQTGHSPRVTELAEYLELDLEDVLVGLDAGSAHYSVSLDAPAPGSDLEEPQSVADTLGDDDDRFALIDTKLSLTGAISKLPYLERQALTLRIEHDLTQTDIAARLGCSQMQVSRLLRRATRSLRTLIDPDHPHSTTPTAAGVAAPGRSRGAVQHIDRRGRG